MSKSKYWALIIAAFVLTVVIYINSDSLYFIIGPTLVTVGITILLLNILPAIVLLVLNKRNGWPLLIGGIVNCILVYVLYWVVHPALPVNQYLSWEFAQKDTTFIIYKFPGSWVSIENESEVVCKGEHWYRGDTLYFNTAYSNEEAPYQMYILENRLYNFKMDNTPINLILIGGEET